MSHNSETENKESQEKQEKKTEKPVKEKMIKIKESEYARLMAEAAKYKDQNMRLYAEFENARKRMDREKMDFVKFANEGLIMDFLGVLDNLERSVDAAKVKHQDYAAFLKGVEMVMAQVNEMLKNNGVVRIETKGKMFDPHCHEILMQEESEELDDGMIVEEFQKGYYLGEKVVRTAKVKVAHKKQENS